MSITEQLQSNLKTYREQAGLTGSELARRSNVSRSMIYQIEHGTSAPTIEIVQQLAMGLGVTLETLLGLDGKVPTVRLEERQHEWLLQHQDADATEADQDGTTIRAIYLSPMQKAKLARQGYQLSGNNHFSEEQQ